MFHQVWVVRSGSQVPTLKGLVQTVTPTWCWTESWRNTFPRLGLDSDSDEAILLSLDNDDRNSHIPVNNMFNFYCDIPETVDKDE